MKNEPDRLVIASRESRLAMWQAEHVRAALQQLYPRCEVTILGMTTRGDQILDRALSKVGGKGLFIKELESALLERRADLAVHSMKDVPVDLAPEFVLAATMQREDPRDAFVSNHHADLASLPPGAIVGTSSLRREAQIRRRYPHLVVQPLRGNLDTRLRKLDNDDYAAIVLAASGLKRLGLSERIRSVMPSDESLPAAGQGALAIEIDRHHRDIACRIARGELLHERERELARPAPRGPEIDIDDLAAILREIERISIGTCGSGQQCGDRGHAGQQGSAPAALDGRQGHWRNSDREMAAGAQRPARV
jgi:hydroxymethylbilane synthase